MVVYGGARDEIAGEWVMNRLGVSRPTLDETKRRISFEGRKARIYYLGGKARLSGERLTVVSPPPLNAFAFSDGTFRFGRQHPGRREVFFSDSSGHYRIPFHGLLASDGTLNRDNRSLLIRTR